LYIYFGVENIVTFSERVFITQTSLSYISGFVAFFTLFGIISFLEKIFQKIAKKIAEKTETDLDNLILDILFNSVHTAKYLLAFYIAWQFVEAPESLNT
jgi:hypothetical protein